MTEFRLIILYVSDVARSAAFYGALLGAAPLEQTEGFAMLPMGGGARLGLWRRDAVEPAAGAGAAGSELCFTVPDVAAQHAAWQAQGLTILQAPVVLDFGETCVAADADGHRLRAYIPAFN
ncbi:VOC family protein [Roseomonas sp. 18066]|uniref:VOC family protein n=1 Tax=Roseomonas sp. 18066 TaxID=2681412 RepID=UPI0013588BAA|nr:VOC family protein [Roseomonas sp. 18066]